jgi:hypothetical protein
MEDPQQQDEACLIGMATAFPRGAALPQHAAASLGAWALLWLNVGMLSSVWKCSQAMPCGSVTQCFSLRA